MQDIEKELRERVKGFGEVNVSFIDYISILNDLFETQNITKTPEKFADVIESYFADEIVEIEDILKGFRFDDAREKSNLFFDKFSNNLDADFAKEVVNNFKSISLSEKNIFLAILGNENGVADFIANKCKEIKDFDKDAIKESVQEFILSERMHEMLSKRIALNADEASYYLFFDYVRQQVLPNMNHESAMKFYIYVESNNFIKDLKEDSSFNDVFVNGTKEQIQEKLFKKIKDKQFPLKLIHDDKGDDSTAKIQVQKLPESYVNNMHKTSPSGYIDYAIFDAEIPNLLHIVNVKASTIESDIYEHDEKSVILDRSLKYWARTNGAILAIHESQGSHKKEKLMKHFLSDTVGVLSEEEYKEVKKVLDTVINKLVDAYNGINKHIIQPGDCKYSAQDLKDKNAYEAFVDFAKLVNEDKLKINGSNSSVFKIASKSIKWLPRVMLKDPEFLSNAENVSQLRNALKGLRNKFVGKDTIADDIKRLLSDTTSDVIGKKIKEAKLNKLDKDINDEHNYYKGLNSLDFISADDHKVLDDLRNRLFTFAKNISKEFVRLEQDNRANATKMSNIKEKYTLIHDSSYAVKSLKDYTGEKQYFTSPNFKATTNYQKDIESIFKLTQFKDGIFDINNVEKTLKKIIKEVQSDIYLDNFDSNANAGLVGGTKVFFMSKMKDKLILEAKRIIKDVNEQVPFVKRKANDKFKDEVEGTREILKTKVEKVRKFTADADDDEFIDPDKLKELENDILKKQSPVSQSNNKNKALQ